MQEERRSSRHEKEDRHRSASARHRCSRHECLTVPVVRWICSAGIDDKPLFTRKGIRSFLDIQHMLVTNHDDASIVVKMFPRRVLVDEPVQWGDEPGRY
jgi:hypothetical protein